MHLILERTTPRSLATKMSLARPNKSAWYHGTKRMRLLVQTTDDVGPPLEKHLNFSGRARSMTVPCVSVLLCSYWWNLRVLHPSGAQSNQIDCIFFTAARPGPRLLFIFLLLWSFQSAQSCNRFLFWFLIFSANQLHRPITSFSVACT